MDKFRICKPDNGSDSSGGQSPDWSSESSSDDEPLSKLKVKFTKERKPLLPRNTENSSQGSHRNSKTKFHDFSMIFP